MRANGLEHKPKLIKFIAGCFLSVPPVILIATLISAGGSWKITSSLLTLDVVFLAVCSYIVGLGVWRVRPWGYISLLLLTFVVLSYITYSGFSDKSIQHEELVLVGFLTLLLAVVFHRNVRAPYFNPRIRWWERAPRSDIDLKGDFEVNGSIFKCQVLDISSTGLFVDLPVELNPGDRVKSKVKLYDIEIESLIIVIRHSEVPKGYGMMFLDLDHHQKKNLKKIVKKLESGEVPLETKIQVG